MIDKIGVLILGIMIGATGGVMVACELRYMVGYEIGSEEAMRSQNDVLEAEFRKNCRPWFTDVKRQTEHDVWMCVKPEFVK